MGPNLIWLISYKESLIDTETWGKCHVTTEEDIGMLNNARNWWQQQTLRKNVALIPLGFRMIVSCIVGEYNFCCFMTLLPVCGSFYGSSRKLIHHSDTKGGHDEPDYLMLECSEEKAVISMGSWWYLERSFMGGSWVFKFSRIWTSKIGRKKKLYYTFRNEYE